MHKVEINRNDRSLGENQVDDNSQRFLLVGDNPTDICIAPGLAYELPVVIPTQSISILGIEFEISVRPEATHSDDYGCNNQGWYSAKAEIRVYGAINTSLEFPAKIAIMQTNDGLHLLARCPAFGYCADKLLKGLRSDFVSLGEFLTQSGNGAVLDEINKSSIILRYEYDSEPIIKKLGLGRWAAETKVVFVSEEKPRVRLLPPSQRRGHLPL